MSKHNEVIVLFDGYSRESEDDPNTMVCNCTSTLIKTKEGQFVLVDTMTPWHRNELVEEIQRHIPAGASAIHHLVCTHGHSDHVGNNNLFLNAVHIVGHDIGHRDRFRSHNFSEVPFRLSDDIEVMATPGHTAKCVSVVVRNCAEGTVVISGDLFEKSDDIDDPELWLGAGSEDETAQRMNRLKIAELADVIIPGHGGKFVVTEHIRLALRKQADNV